MASFFSFSLFPAVHAESVGLPVFFFFFPLSPPSSPPSPFILWQEDGPSIFFLLFYNTKLHPKVFPSFFFFPPSCSVRKERGFFSLFLFFPPFFFFSIEIGVSRHKLNSLYLPPPPFFRCSTCVYYIVFPIAFSLLHHAMCFPHGCHAMFPPPLSFPL